MGGKQKRRKSCENAPSGAPNAPRSKADAPSRRHAETSRAAEFFGVQPRQEDERELPPDSDGLVSPGSNKRKRSSDEETQPDALQPDAFPGSAAQRPTKRGKTVRPADGERGPEPLTHAEKDAGAVTLAAVGGAKPNVSSVSIVSAGEFRHRSVRRRHTMTGTGRSSRLPLEPVPSGDLAPAAAVTSQVVPEDADRPRRASAPSVPTAGLDADDDYSFCCYRLHGTTDRLALRHGFRNSYPEANLELMKERARQFAAAVKPDYFSKLPPSISPRSRCIVTQWMVYVQRKLPSPLNPFSLHVAISLLDRFLSSLAEDYTERPKNTLRLRAGKERQKVKDNAAENLENIGAACLFIASKLEDVWPVDVKDLCTLSNGEVTAKCVLLWEMRILAELDFDVNFPTLLDFLYFLLHASGAFATPPKPKEGGGTADPSLGTAKTAEVDSTASEPDDGSLHPLLKSSTVLHPPEWKPRYEWGKGRSALEASAEYLAEVVLMHHTSLGLPAHHLAAACFFAVITYLSQVARSMSNLPQQVLDVVAATAAEKDLFRVSAARVCAILEEHESSVPDADAQEVTDETTGDIRLLNFAGDVDAKHKDACMHLLSKYCKWKVAFNPQHEASVPTL